MGESFTAQLTTGIASLTVGFAAPPARGAAQPTLGLVYASAGGFGLAGVGWSLAGPVFVARQTDRGIPRYDDREDWHPEQDRFIFGGQELVPICKVADGACAGSLAGEVMPSWADGWQYFRARVEGAFLRFFWSSDHLTWRVQSKQGISFELGRPLDGSGYDATLERNPHKPAEIYRWHLVRQYDSHGAPNATPPRPVNIVQYRYFQDGGIAYLSDVYHTPPAANSADAAVGTYAHHVSLGYEARPDTATSYANGWALEQRLRLSRVDVTSKPFAGTASSKRELVRRYHLTYVPSRAVSLLASVQQEGRCNEAILEDNAEKLGATDCPRLPATSFEYQQVRGKSAPLTDGAGNAFEPFNEVLREVANSPKHSQSEAATTFFDVNSDGLPDVLVTAAGLYDGQHAVFFNRGERQGKLEFAPLTKMSVEGVNGVDAGVLKLDSPNVSILDINGDATADLVHVPLAKRYSVFSPKRTGSSWSWAGQSTATASGQDVKINFAQDARRTAVMDVNGDGLVDVVFASATEYQTFLSLGRYPGGEGQFGNAGWTSSDSATISNDPITSCTPWSGEPVRLGDADVRVADVNGDGLPDIVRLRSGQIHYWPGRGNGFFGTGDRSTCPGGAFGQDRHIEMASAPQYGVTQAGTLHLADVNGDGRADLVEVRADAVDIYLNVNGNSWTERQTLRDVPIKPNANNHVRLADINGSGSVDIVWGQGYEYQYIDLTGGVRPHLLVKAHNGLGRTSELQYKSSTTLMVEADEANKPWTTVCPMSSPVVVKSTVRDNLDKVGRVGGQYITEYRYRDPVFDGRQREFRGFRTAETRALGDASSPTSIARSTHLLGECEVAQNGTDVCSFADRWKDNWREPLKGLTALTEIFDEQGVYLSTVQPRYELRQLYKGRDGRRVSVLYGVGQDSFGYDTSAFVASDSQVELDFLTVAIDGIAQQEKRLAPKRASSGTVRLHATTVSDDFGNPTQSSAFGCIEGCAQADEVITQYASHGRPDGDESGWLWRPMSGYASGSIHTAPRMQSAQEYDPAGDVVRTTAVLSGTLPLDRFHESGKPIAPPPSDASAGVAEAVTIETGRFDRDAFGHVVKGYGPNGRCRSVSFDSLYAELPVEETSYGGNAASNGCGERTFTISGTFDRGLGLVLTSLSITGQPSKFDYDGFGRLVAATHADPDSPGSLSPVPSSLYEYLLPADASVTPYSIVTSRTQDGLSKSSSEYHESYAYIDGLGRKLIVLSEADPTAGDGGSFVAGGFVDYDAKGAPLRGYLREFWSGDPLAYPLAQRPTTRFTSRQSDAFGRVVYSLGLDGAIKAYTTYRALSADVWDAADIQAGPHQGSYATSESDGHGRRIRAVERVHVGATLEQRETLTEYLPTGETLKVTQRRAGSPDTVRWMRYDSLGRVVMNVEANTSVGFSADPSADASGIKAWRYAYNDSGALVGSSDARGCGVNTHFDTAGRVIAKDYSPCLDSHPDYTAPDLATGDGTEAFFRYDTADPETPMVSQSAGVPFAVDTAQLWGRAVSVADRGSKGLVSYDGLGRVTSSAIKVARPGAATNALATRYAPRWYVRSSTFDAAGRPLTTTTGVRSAELLGSNGESVIQTHYSARGGVQQVTSSYGTLTVGRIVDANGLVTKTSFGDAAQTERALGYDEQQRLRTAQTYRAAADIWTDPKLGTPAEGEPTQQLLLEDIDLEYDAVNNITRISDWRADHEWPESAKPVTRRFEYDDLYRLTRTVYDSPTGTDTWKSPFAAENEGEAAGPKPSPHVSFDKRVIEQRYQYDHLGNTSKTTDDASGFFDRSLGTITNGGTNAGPHQVTSASNRTIASSSPRKGDLDAAYDPSGNLTELIVRRDGPCLPSGTSCYQRYLYSWDEVGQLSLARRYDLKAANPDERAEHGALGSPVPSRAPDVELRYTYDSGGQRVLKTAVDPSGNEQHTVYIIAGLELRKAAFEGTGPEADYTLNANTETLYLPGIGVRARVLYAEHDLPSLVSGRQHLLLEFSDHLGSGTFIIDHASGELVEYATYQSYGQTDSNYRPARWGEFREAYKFGGKEEDVEIGLAYFGARYLSLGLGRWISPDPVTIHALRGDLNPYAYVAGRPLVAVDPDGREIFTVIAVGFLVGALVGATTSAVTQYVATGQVNWGWGGVLGATVAGGVAGGVGAGLGATLGGGLFGYQVSGAAAGASGAATGRALQGGGFADVLSAAGWGAVAGFAGGTAGHCALSSGWAASTVASSATGTAVGALAQAVDGQFNWRDLVLSAAVGVGSGLATRAIMRDFDTPDEPSITLEQVEKGSNLYRMSESTIDELAPLFEDIARKHGQDARLMLRDVRVQFGRLGTAYAEAGNQSITIDLETWAALPISEKTALLAHEAVHLVQERMLGGGLIGAARVSARYLAEQSGLYGPSDAVELLSQGKGYGMLQSSPIQSGVHLEQTARAVERDVLLTIRNRDLV